MESITDLEAVALGHILQFQPCTAHFIRGCFRDSPATRFSDSAGSVYPMMKRLERRGLTSSELVEEGNRQIRYYVVTREGRNCLKQWIGPPLDDEVALTVDPLRTRSIYLRHLTPKRRRMWLDEAEQILQRKIAEVDQPKYRRDSSTASESSRVDSIFFELANENARQDLKHRLKWVRQIRNRLLREGLLG